MCISYLSTYFCSTTSSLVLATRLDGCSHLRIVIWFPFSPTFNPFSLEQPEGFLKTKIGWRGSLPWNMLHGNQNKIQAFVHCRPFFEFLPWIPVLFCVKLPSMFPLSEMQAPSPSIPDTLRPHACPYVRHRHVHLWACPVFQLFAHLSRPHRALLRFPLNMPFSLMVPWPFPLMHLAQFISIDLGLCLPPLLDWAPEECRAHHVWLVSHCTSCA